MCVREKRESAKQFGPHVSCTLNAVGTHQSKPGGLATIQFHKNPASNHRSSQPIIHPPIPPVHGSNLESIVCSGYVNQVNGHQIEYTEYLSTIKIQDGEGERGREQQKPQTYRAFQLFTF